MVLKNVSTLKPPLTPLSVMELLQAVDQIGDKREKQVELAKSGESVGASLANTTRARVYGAKFFNDLVAEMQGSKKGGNRSYRNAIIESRLNVMRIEELTYKWYECL